MVKKKDALSSVEKYLSAYSIEEILQDARLILESNDVLCRKALAGTILVSLDHIESRKSLAGLNEFKKEINELNVKVDKYRITVENK